MFAVELTWDQWEGTEEEGVLLSPSLDDIERAIRRLDGEIFSLVTVAGKGDAHLAIGGGSLDQYVVYATYDNEKFFRPLSAKEGAETVHLVAGGQPGDYPAHTIINLEASLTAARTFAESGTLDPSLTWFEE